MISAEWLEITALMVGVVVLFLRVPVVRAMPLVWMRKHDAKVRI